jgi:hypothetical protein
MPSAIGTPREAALADHCRRLVFMKYRIDDFMDTLWQRYGADDSVLESHGIDWLEEVAQNPAMNDNPAVRDFSGRLYGTPNFTALSVSTISTAMRWILGILCGACYPLPFTRDTIVPTLSCKT